MDSGFFMSVAQDLGAVLDFAEQPLSRLDVFTDHIPQEWISTAATLAEKATVRRRRLPSDMVLWLVVGMALFRGEPIVEVARRLNICADGLANEVLLAKSGLSQARQRLGNQPVSWLFRQCASTCV
ncbi:transposase domain-containing protein, partial [Pseudomonas syringae]|uniref:transposase domain-containing protein n=1 Tax=Pseudomonas syringae TaxID=317 RepID=UPI00159354AB